MIEALITAVLVKIAEGSGTALVDAIRSRLKKKPDSAKVGTALDLVASGSASPEVRDDLRARLVEYAEADPEFEAALRAGVDAHATTNVVRDSVVGKLVQADRVGDIHM